MVEFDEEQEQEIQLRIQKAQQESINREQWVLSADQFFREGISSTTSKVSQGIYDPYILEVGKALYAAFRNSNFSPKKQEKEDAVSKQV